MKDSDEQHPVAWVGLDLSGLCIWKGISAFRSAVLLCREVGEDCLTDQINMHSAYI